MGFSASSVIGVMCVNESGADLSDDLSQPRVAHHQPAAGSDAVGLVLELVRLHFVEVLETVNKVEPSHPRTGFAKQFHLSITDYSTVYLRDIHCRFEDVGVDLGHAIDSVRAHNAQVSHVDPLLAALFNEGHTAQAVTIAGILCCNFLQINTN